MPDFKFRMRRSLLAALALCAPFVTPAAMALPGAPISLTRGVLLVGKFRTQQELNGMTGEEQRNTLIAELAGRTRDDVRFYQGLNNAELAGFGAFLVYLRETGSRTDAQIRTMSADDMRNTVIVEAAAQTGRGSDLQYFNNLDVIRQVIEPGDGYIRAVLLLGRFRTQQQLNGMPAEDRRNTLIVELVGRTSGSIASYQALGNADLAGAGALLVYLRETGARTDAQIQTMSADDMRNTMIVEMNVQTGRSDLQAFANMQLALMALGSPQITPW